MTVIKNLLVYCMRCHKQTVHLVKIEDNGRTEATCNECGKRNPV